MATTSSLWARMRERVQTAVCPVCSAKIDQPCYRPQQGTSLRPYTNYHRERFEAAIYQHHQGRVYRSPVRSGDARRKAASLAVALVVCPRPDCLKPAGEKCQLNRHLWGKQSIIYNENFPSCHKERLVDYLLTIDVEDLKSLTLP